MQINIVRSFIWALIIPVFLLPGCQSGQKNKRGLIDDEETFEIVERIETMKNVYHLCPSPAEMLSVIDMADYSFDGGLLNPVGNVDSYLDTRSRTLNLGVYITDLAYCALFGRHEETLDYLDVVGSVADQIRITGAINEELIENARNNVEYLDSLFNISNEAFVNMLFFCERNNRPNTIVLLSTGAFIESLYLAVNLVDDYDDAGPIIQHLAEQKYAIDNLMVFAGSMKEEDENVASVIRDIQPVKDVYDGLEMGKGATTATKDESNKLVIGGGRQPELSREEFEVLKKATLALRQKFIES